MGRPPRLEEPGAIYHVTARGNARGAIARDDLDRRRFDDVAVHVKRRSGWIWLAHCQMGNHFHLVIKTPEPTLANGMQLLCGELARRFNRRHAREGHLFQSRYAAKRIKEDAHLLESCRYTVLNPVRARLVHDAGEWEWSSYRETAGLIPPRLVDLDAILGLFHPLRERAFERYRRFVADGALRTAA